MHLDGIAMDGLPLSGTICIWRGTDDEFRGCLESVHGKVFGIACEKCVHKESVCISQYEIAGTDAGGASTDDCHRVVGGVHHAGTLQVVDETEYPPCTCASFNR